MGQEQSVHLLKTSAAIGTVELTGLEMMATQACGQYLATPAHRFGHNACAMHLVVSAPVAGAGLLCCLVNPYHQRTSLPKCLTIEWTIFDNVAGSSLRKGL